MKVKLIILTFAFILSLKVSAQSSLRSYSLSGGAAKIKSASYSLKATIGQTFAGSAKSANYKTDIGFDASSVVDQIADLDFISFVPSPTNVGIGKELKLFFKIKNIGTNVIDQDVLVKAFLSANPVLDQSDLEVSSFIVANHMNAGEEINESDGIAMFIPSTLIPGDYFLFLSADPLNTIKERREDNNTISGSITAVDKSDKQSPLFSSVSSGAFKPGALASATVVDNEALGAVKFFYRPITSKVYLTTPLTVSGSSFSVAIDESWGDELGMESYFTAVDGLGNKGDSASTHKFWYRAADPDKAIPFTSSFGGSTNTYEMFSIPYVLERNGITNIFDELSGGEYDKKQWRVFHYKDGAVNESATTSIVPGVGYWINMREKQAVKIGAGTVVPNNQSNDFEISLAPGWNQIGNPYPFSISWDVVAGANDQLGELNFWNGNGYSTNDQFLPWKGAFVHNDAQSPINVQVPVTAGDHTSRIKSEEWGSPDSETWHLPIEITAGGIRLQVGVGMHPRALSSKDRFDKIALPLFAGGPRMDTYHPEFFSHHFATDIVPVGDEQRWAFHVETDADDKGVVLRWDPSVFSGSIASIILIDDIAEKWVDMKAVGTYELDVAEPRNISILYNKSGETNPGITIAGDAFPNPFVNEVTFPVLLSTPGTYRIEIYDALGRKVKVLKKEFRNSGEGVFDWDGTTDHGEAFSGLLFYRMTGERVTTAARRLMKVR